MLNAHMMVGFKRTWKLFNLLSVNVKKIFSRTIKLFLSITLTFTLTFTFPFIFTMFSPSISYLCTIGSEVQENPDALIDRLSIIIKKIIEKYSTNGEIKLDVSQLETIKSDLAPVVAAVETKIVKLRDPRFTDGNRLTNEEFAVYDEIIKKIAELNKNKKINTSVVSESLLSSTSSSSNITTATTNSRRHTVSKSIGRKVPNPLALFSKDLQDIAKSYQSLNAEIKKDKENWWENKIVTFLDPKDTNRVARIEFDQYYMDNYREQYRIDLNNDNDKWDQVVDNKNGTITIRFPHYVWPDDETKMFSWHEDEPTSTEYSNLLSILRYMGLEPEMVVKVVNGRLNSKSNLTVYHGMGVEVTTHLGKRYISDIIIKSDLTMGKIWEIRRGALASSIKGYISQFDYSNFKKQMSMTATPERVLVCKQEKELLAWLLKNFNNTSNSLEQDRNLILILNELVLNKADLDKFNITDFIKSKFNERTRSEVSQTTVLHLAVIYEKEELVKALLKHPGINLQFINQVSELGNTALIMAARFGNTNIFKMLLKAGADITIRNNDGDSLLSYAVKFGQTKIIKELSDYLQSLEGGTSTRIAESSSLSTSSITCTPSTASNSTIHTDLGSSDCKPSSVNHIDIPDYDGAYAIHKIIPDMPEQYSVNFDVRATELLDLLLNFKTLNLNINIQEGHGNQTSAGETILMKAARLGYPRLIEQLLFSEATKNKIDVNLLNFEGKNALDLATEAYEKWNKLNPVRVRSSSVSSLDSNSKVNSNISSHPSLRWKSIILAFKRYYDERVDKWSQGLELKLINAIQNLDINKIDLVLEEISKIKDEPTRKKILNNHLDLVLIKKIQSFGGVEDDVNKHSLVQIIEKLIKKGFELTPQIISLNTITQKGSTFLQLAISFKNKFLVSKILDTNDRFLQQNLNLKAEWEKYVNWVNDFKYSALCSAVALNDLELVQLLLKSGAKVIVPFSRLPMRGSISEVDIEINALKNAQEILRDGSKIESKENLNSFNEIISLLRASLAKNNFDKYLTYLHNSYVSEINSELDNFYTEIGSGSRIHNYRKVVAEKMVRNIKSTLENIIAVLSKDGIIHGSNSYQNFMQKFWSSKNFNSKNGDTLFKKLLNVWSQTSNEVENKIILDFINELLSEGVVFEESDAQIKDLENNSTLLLDAILGSNSSLISWLLKNIKEWKNSVDKVEYLNYPNKNGLIAFNQIISRNLNDFINLFLELGADPNFRDLSLKGHKNGGRNAWETAIQVDNKNAIHLLNSYYNKNISKWTKRIKDDFITAIDMADLSAVDNIIAELNEIENMPSTTNINKSEVKKAVWTEVFSYLRKILFIKESNQKNRETNRENALSVLVKLLKSGVELDKELLFWNINNGTEPVKTSLLNLLVEKKSLDLPLIANVLKQASAILANSNATVSSSSAMVSSSSSVDRIISIQNYIDMKNEVGNCALAIAALRGEKELCKLLITAGANINCLSEQKGFEGFTPLMMAAWGQKSELFFYLLEEGANKDLSNSEGLTALKIATSNDCKEITNGWSKYLIKSDFKTYLSTYSNKYFKALLDAVNSAERGSSNNPSEKVRIILEDIKEELQAGGIKIPSNEYFMFMNKLFTIQDQHANNLLLIALNNWAQTASASSSISASSSASASNIASNNTISSEQRRIITYFLQAGAFYDPEMAATIKTITATNNPATTSSSSITNTNFDPILGRTLLSDAAFWNDKELVKWILFNLKKWGITNNRGETLSLHNFATSVVMMSKSKYKQQQYIHAVDNKGQYALGLASVAGNLEIVKMLLAVDENPNWMESGINEECSTVLVESAKELALKSNKTEVINFWNEFYAHNSQIWGAHLQGQLVKAIKGLNVELLDRALKELSQIKEDELKNLILNDQIMHSIGMLNALARTNFHWNFKVSLEEMLIQALKGSKGIDHKDTKKIFTIMKNLVKAGMKLSDRLVFSNYPQMGGNVLYVASYFGEHDLATSIVKYINRTSSDPSLKSKRDAYLADFVNSISACYFLIIENNMQILLKNKVTNPTISQLLSNLFKELEASLRDLGLLNYPEIYSQCKNKIFSIVSSRKGKNILHQAFLLWRRADNANFEKECINIIIKMLEEGATLNFEQLTLKSTKSFYLAEGRYRPLISRMIKHPASINLNSDKATNVPEYNLLITILNNLKSWPKSARQEFLNTAYGKAGKKSLLLNDAITSSNPLYGKEIIKLFLELGADPNKYVDKGALPEDLGKDALQFAIVADSKNKKSDYVELLYEFYNKNPHKMQERQKLRGEAKSEFFRGSSPKASSANLSSSSIQSLPSNIASASSF